MSRSAKVAKVIPIETPDNSSSDEETQEDQAEELQVYHATKPSFHEWCHLYFRSPDLWWELLKLKFVSSFTFFYKSLFSPYNLVLHKVEFEARAPDEEDFHGIKLLIKQLFCRNSSVNPSKITETILSQRYIGSVIKTVQAEEDDLEEEMADDDHIYAISTVINLAKKE